MARVRAAAVAFLAMIGAPRMVAAAEGDPCACSAAKPNFMRRAALTGDWDGGRTWLVDHGVTLGASYAGEIFASPEAQRSTVVAGLGALSIDLSLDRLIAPRLGSIHVVGFGIHGEGLSAQLKDIYGVSNNVATDEVRLFEAWIDQPLGPAGVRAGLLSADQEFVLAAHGSALMNATFGVIGQIATNLGGPVYPVATPGVSGRVEAGPVRVRAAIYEGDLQDVHGVPDRLNRSVLGIGELELWSTVKVGGWVHSDKPNGVYAVADRGFGKRLGAFARVGVCPDGLVQIYADAGLRGPPTDIRKDDFAAIGVAYSRTVQAGVVGNQAVIEATWQFSIARWMTIQPDMQLVFASTSTALVGGVRTTIAF